MAKMPMGLKMAMAKKKPGAMPAMGKKMGAMPKPSGGMGMDAPTMPAMKKGGMVKRGKY